MNWQAQALLQEHQQEMMMNPEAAYGAPAR